MSTSQPNPKVHAPLPRYRSPIWATFRFVRKTYILPRYSLSLHHHLLFIAIPLSATRFMKTRQKNGSTHPGKPDMTPSQLRSAGLSRTTNVRNPPTTSKKLSTTSKKPTKDQQIAALENELRAIRELISSVCHDPPHPVYCSVLMNPFFRTTQTYMQRKTIRRKHHSMLAVTPIPQPIPMRSRLLPLARSARVKGLRI